MFDVHDQCDLPFFLMFWLYWQLLFYNGFDNVHTTFFVHKQYLSEGATAFEPTEHDVHVLVYGGIKLKKKDNKCLKRVSPLKKHHKQPLKKAVQA